MNRSGRHVVHFVMAVCLACPHLSECPVKRGKNRYELRFNDKKLRLARRRRAERQPAFREKYRWRAGGEATMSELDRKTGLKKLRVRGQPAVRLCAKLKAAGVNILRAARVYVARLAKMRPSGPQTPPDRLLGRIYSVMQGHCGGIWGRTCSLARRSADFVVPHRSERDGRRISFACAA